MRRTFREDEDTAPSTQAFRHRCLTCGAGAPWEVLSAYGARCTSCYGAYLRNHTPASNGPPLTRDDKRQLLEHLRGMLSRQDDPKAWAYRLREREARGERLSPMQADAWRRALRATTTEAA